MRMLSTCLIICQVFSAALGESCESEHCNFFDFRLLQAACDVDDYANVVVAPLSVKVTLMALLEGSDGKTRQEILSSLKLPSGVEDIRQEASDALLPFQGTDPGIKCEMVSCLWFAEGIQTFGNYTETIENYYNSSYETVDFTNPTNSAEIINEWMNRTTNNDVESIIKSGELGNNTRIVMTSALRFKGNWHCGFYEDSHWTGCYAISGRACQAIRVMHNRFEHNYALIESLDAEVVEVSYVNERLSLLVFRPQKEGFYHLNDLIKKLARTPISEILGRLEKKEIDLVLPMFRIEAKTDLVPALRNMGIKNLFEKTANLSGMLQNSQVGVDNIFYDVKIETHTVGEIENDDYFAFVVDDEEDAFKDFDVDRPFVFAIVDRLQRSVLFAGRIIHPEYDLTKLSDSPGLNMYGDYSYEPFMANF